MTVDMDEWREVVNGEHTYHQIAVDLNMRAAVIVGWTDDRSTHYDILFTLRPAQQGSLEGGLCGPTNLFVSIMGRGCFGFRVGEHELHGDYIAEKLGLYNGSPTCHAFTDLVNGVMRALVGGAGIEPGHMRSNGSRTLLDRNAHGRDPTRR